MIEQVHMPAPGEGGSVGTWCHLPPGEGVRTVGSDWYSVSCCECVAMLIAQSQQRLRAMERHLSRLIEMEEQDG